MTTQEAAQRLADLLNELGAEGISASLCAGAISVSRGSGNDLQYTNVGPVGARTDLWEVEVR